MNRALVIIDMQSYFDHCDTVTNILQSCRREIKQAIEDNIKIVLVEWEGLGSTIKSLRDMVEDYPNLSVVLKDDDNGSQQIINEIGNSYNILRVCGVNTDCCVIATVKGLTELCYNLNIEVVADAVNTCWQNDHSTALMKMKTFPRTRVC